MKRSHFVRLRDLLDAVAEMIEGADFASYRGDVKLKRAVERCVEIVSEASRHLSPAATDRYPDQPWSEIAAIGNLLRHEYQRVDDLIMWKIASRSLPALRAAVSEMLGER
ncbi:MAG: HepT-like ribonuclease domain-containing protein [Bauldia sp.]